jgi:glycosyltransferase involved in cell wall biosynthesis
MPPLVSIITPTGNRERFLPAIARCVSRQHVAWEWLVLDDSPQPSAFMQKLSQTDSRIRYTHVTQRMSIGSKRNHVISEAQGSIIAHFDDDDHYASHYLSRMVNLLEDNQAALIKLSGFYMYAPHTEFLGYMDLNAEVGLHYELTGTMTRQVEFHSKMKIGKDFILFYGFAYVYRKSLSAVAHFDDIDLGDDESFIRRVVQNRNNVIAADDQTQSCLHLIHPASTSRCFSRYSMPPFILQRLFPEYEGYPG